MSLDFFTEAPQARSGEPETNLDLAELLLGARSQPEELEPGSLAARLEDLHSRYPGNLSAAAAESPDLEKSSERVRINRACAWLNKQGALCHGGKFTHPEPTIRVSASYNYRGRVNTFSVEVKENRLKQHWLSLCQEALLKQGLRPLLTLGEKLILIQEGQSGTELADWLAAGLPLSLLNAGVPLEEAEAWSQRMDAQEVEEFYSAGYGLEEAWAWTEAGVADAAGAAEWKTAGFTPAQVGEFSSAHHYFSEYASFRPFLDEGFELDWLLAWKGVYQHSWRFAELSTHQEMRELGLSEQHGQVFTRAGTGQREITGLLTQLHATPLSQRPRLLEWLAVHPALQAHYPEHERLGRTPAQLAEWVSGHARLCEPEQIAAWEADGLGPEEATRWARHSSLGTWGNLWERETVRGWEAAGEWGRDPERVARLLKERVSGPEQIARLLAICGEASEPDGLPPEKRGE